MIIEEKKSEAQYSGDIQANKVGIDTRNLDFIASLLTTNLYSNPIRSFLRETISNGWDSHIEAGHQEPVLVILDTEDMAGIQKLANYYSNPAKILVTIRDFGVGLSPERFYEIYTNIGSSTKRGSNDFIGAFGIGRFSCLSCADSAMVDSYYNGTRYSYLMYKNGAGINIDKLGEFPTTEKNGVSVKVELTLNRDMLKQLPFDFMSLAFFNCIYIQDSQNILDDFANNFNNRGTKKFKHMAYWHMTNKPSKGYYDKTEIQLVVGNVVYPLDKKYLAMDVFEDDGYPIYLNFEIGDLDVTPNRENVLYNTKTEAKIAEVAKLAAAELKEYILEQTAFDFPDIIQWYKFVSMQQLELTIPLSHDQSCKFYVRQKFLQKLNFESKVTLKGKQVPSDLQSVCNYIAQEPISRHAVMITYKPTNVTKFVKLASNTYFSTSLKNLIVESYHQYFKYFTYDSSWNTITKEYAAEKILGKSSHYNHYIFSIPQLKKQFLEIYKHLLTRKDPRINTVKYILRELKDQQYFTVFSEADVPQQWIDDREARIKAEKAAAKATTPVTKKEVRNCVVRTLAEGSRYDYSRGGYAPVFKDDIYDYNGVKSNTTLTFVYTDTNLENTEYLISLFDLYRNIGCSETYKFITVAPKNIPALAELPNTIEMNTWVNSNLTMFRNRASIDWDFRDILYRNCFSLFKAFPTLNAKFAKYKESLKEGCETRNVASKTNKVFEEIMDLYKKNNWVNNDMISLQTDYKINLLLNLSSCLSPIYNESTFILVDYNLRHNISDVDPVVYNSYLNSEYYKSIAIKTN